MLPAGILLRAALVGLAAVLLVAGCSPGCGRLCQPDFWETADIADVEAELEAGADVNGISETRLWSPLQLVIERGLDFDAIVLLLRLRADRSYTVLKSPLHLAIEHGADADVVALLLKRGADSNASGHTVLYGHHAPYRSHRTPLQLAIEQYNRPPAIIQLLLAYGANPNPPTGGYSDGESPLYYASGLWYEGDRAIIEVLLEHGADPNAKSSDGRTPFQRALPTADPSLTQLFLDRGADLSERDEQGNYPLHLATHANKHVEVVALLLDYGADVDARNKYGETPLHLTIGQEAGLTRDRREKVIALLLDQGADVDAWNIHRETPLSWAAKSYPSLVPRLLMHGADPNRAARIGTTPLHWVVRRGMHSSIAEVLLDHGADVEARTKEVADSPSLSAATPLHWAMPRSSPEVIALLLDRGADTAAQNELGQTPCQMAKERDRPEEVLQLVCS